MRTAFAPSELVLLPEFQPRVKLDLDLVKEYSEAMLSGWGDFPPVEVFRLGEKFVVVDGFHRVKAALAAKLPKVPANLREGTPDEALLFCVKANSTHGLRRTNEDKRRAVEMLLDHPKFGTLGKAKLADLAGVSKPMVLDVIRKREGELTTHERRKVQRVDSTPLPVVVAEKLSPSLKALAADLATAGASPEVIDKALSLAIARRKPKGEAKPKRSTEERLRYLLEKVAKERNKVAVVTLEDATPRTKTFAKLPRTLTGKVS